MTGPFAREAWRRAGRLLCASVLALVAAACSGADFGPAESVDSVTQALVTTVHLQQGSPPDLVCDEVTGACSSPPAPPGTPAVATYQGASDATISRRAPETLFGTNGRCVVDGARDERSCLLRWDLSAIPRGALVKAASITVRISVPTGVAHPLYALNRGWDPASVSWSSLRAGQAWAAPGATAEADRETTALGFLLGERGRRKIALNAAGVAAVQAWVTDPSQNHGLIIADADEPDGAQLDSADVASVADRPRLSVSYEE